MGKKKKVAPPQASSTNYLRSFLAVAFGVAVAICLPHILKASGLKPPGFAIPVKLSAKPPAKPPIKRAISEEQRRYENLVGWLEHGGAEFPHLTMRDYSNENRGVISTKRIREGDQFIKIPESHLMTEYDALQCDLVLTLQKKDVSDFKYSYTLLSLYLLQEKHKEGSYWSPYLNMLPTSFPTLPLFWSNSDLKHLQGSSLESKQKKISQGLKKEYDYIVFYYPEFKYTFEEFLWAQSVVSTRSFRFLMDGEVVTSLVPLVDMLNHKEPAEAHYEYDEDGQAFVMTSRVDVSKGEEVYDYYGSKGNSRLLFHYGFTIEDNPSDEYNIEVTVPEWLESVWGRQSFAFSLTIGYEKPQSQKGWSVLRLFEYDSHEYFDQVTDQEETFDYIDLETELKVLDRLADIVTQKLKPFKTTIKKDERRLKKADSANERNALKVRIGEMKVLEYHKYFIEAATKLLNMEQNELIELGILPNDDQQEQKHGYGEYKAYSAYIQKVVVPLKT